MENASKALIIAGAILLAILIIGLGIFIYRQAANTVSDTGMDQLAIQQFNAQFTQYDSKTVSGGSARALYDTVVNNNNTDTEKRFVSLNLVAKTADGTKNIVLADIYAAREQDPGDISSKTLQAELEKLGKKAYYFPSFDEIEKFWNEKIVPYLN